MVNYIPVNCTNDDLQRSNKLKTSFENLFAYTKEVNIHVIFNLKSPIDSLGEYSYVIFIDIPYRQGNYYYVKEQDNRIYLNSLAIAIKDYEDNSVIDVKDGEVINKDGTWDYQAVIEEEKAGLIRFVHNYLSDVKHFNIAIFHRLTSTQCNSGIKRGNLSINDKMNVWEVVNSAIKETVGNNGKSCECIVNKSDNRDFSWTSFVSQFIEACEKRTKQGILTKRKIDEISKDRVNVDVREALDYAGERLAIVKGKAGTGKSLTLIKIMYHKVQKDEEKRNHRCRLLTYNNLLVIDIKQLLKSMGNDFAPCNAAVSTLHKYFLDIYKNSPVRVFHMDEDEINKLFTLCQSRVAKIVTLIEAYRDEFKDKQVEAPEILKYWNDEGKIEKSDYKECELFCRYLYQKSRYLDYDKVLEMAEEYQSDKRRRFDEYFAQNEFLNDYNRILEELYLLFHNRDEFFEKYGMSVFYTDQTLRNTEAFKRKYEEAYKKFMDTSKKTFAEEHELPNEKSITAFIEDEARILREIREERKKQSDEKKRDDLENQVKKILRKIRWSNLIIVDEAQDCTPFEKALLLEMHGPENIVIASGGKDQLIRTSLETDWTVQFGTPLRTGIVTLDYVHRSKANIVQFVNDFAVKFNLNANLKSSESSRNQGSIIVDIRTGIPQKEVPLDMVNRLYMSGKDYGCADYENLMFLFPRGEYVKYGQTKIENVSIDRYDTINFTPTASERHLDTKLPEYIDVLDCTITRKHTLLEDIGYNKTRCLLYESCRGIEAWNVLCIDLDKFYHNQFLSEEAIVYAKEAAGLFQDEATLSGYKHQYASLWVLMAITRAIDTLYIKLSNPYSDFARKVIEIARNTSYIELIEGVYKSK